MSLQEPDFEALAHVLDNQLRAIISSQESDQSQSIVAMWLRDIWNARGAADLETVYGSVTRGQEVCDIRPDIQDAIRALDR